MRLSEWKAAAPHKDSVTPQGPCRRRADDGDAGLVSRTPLCWVLWGDDPEIRWLHGLRRDRCRMVQVNVRVNAPGEGPEPAAS